MYLVIDIKLNEVFGEFETLEEAEEFLENDCGDHNLEIEEVA